MKNKIQTRKSSLLKLVAPALSRLVAPALLALAASGCGPSLVNDEMDHDFRSPDSFQYTVRGEYTCPTETNVLPYEDRLFDGTQRYTVCAHESQESKIQIMGYSSSDRFVCVFPLQFLDESRFVYKVGPNGLPLSTCYDAATLRTKEFDFFGTAFNGMAVADKSDLADMNRCLMNRENCPTFSIGQFR